MLGSNSSTPEAPNLIYGTGSRPTRPRTARHRRPVTAPGPPPGMDSVDAAAGESAVQSGFAADGIIREE